MKAAQVFAWWAVAERSRSIRLIAPVLVAGMVFGLGCALRLPAGLQQQAQEAARQATLNEQQAASAAKLEELQRLRRLWLLPNGGCWRLTGTWPPGKA